MTPSGSWRSAYGVAEEIEPSHGFQIVDMDIVVKACRISIPGIIFSQDFSQLSPFQYSVTAISSHFADLIRFSLLTFLPSATEDVDPAVIARRESVGHSFRRQASAEEDIGAAPGWELDA